MFLIGWQMWRPAGLHTGGAILSACIAVPCAAIVASTRSILKAVTHSRE
jgi:hypothetical protein